MSGVPVCVPFDISLLCVFLLFVCNPAKVCLREKEDLTISCVFAAQCCLFLFFSMYISVFPIWRLHEIYLCLLCGVCLFVREGRSDYI